VSEDEMVEPNDRDETLDPLLGRIATGLREPVRLDPSFDRRVMAAVRREAAPRKRSMGRAVSWMTRPRPVRISPLAGLALAAGIAGIAIFTARNRDGDGTPRNEVASALPEPVVVSNASAANGGGARVIQFVFVAPNAASVAIAGDFNDWDPAANPLRRSAAGVWSATVTLEPGRHLYAFIVDGKQWVADPTAPSAPGDDFGTPNSMITVGVSST
jgi:hypothetical protein